jgi:hypothetical protein
MSNYRNTNPRSPHHGRTTSYAPSDAGSLPFDHVATPSSRLELSIAARNLVDADTFSLSDPFCVVSAKSAVGRRWHELGRTEIIWNNLNPQWVKKFKVEYFFEEIQHLKFAVYDADTKQGTDLAKQDFLGEVETTLAEIVSGGSTFRRSLNKIARGDLEVRCEELLENNDLLTAQFRGIKLDRKDWFGSSDPFFTLSKANEAGGYTIVHKSEVLKVNLNPRWIRFTIKVLDLCNGDIDRDIKIDVYDYNKNGRHKMIGSCSTTVRELEESAGGQRWKLMNAKKQAKKRKYKGSGTMELTFCQKEKIHTFVEFLRGGMEMNFEVGIDFTQSNGQVNDPSSLHFINNQVPGHLNEYALAIKSVGDIIQAYDTDKLFPVWGFGARLPHTSAPSHRFSVNFNPNDPNCHTIDGVLEAYQRCIRSVQLWGPTNFSPIIRGITQSAKSDTSGRQYWVLLMITDGIISDMEPTKRAIVEAAKYPISIIIIGVGDADFSNMNVLDGDDVRVSYNGERAVRDIVQFVPIRDFFKKGTGQVLSQARLAQEVLHEIPDQVSEYMKQHHILPMSEGAYYSADPPSY